MEYEIIAIEIAMGKLYILVHNGGELQVKCYDLATL